MSKAQEPPDFTEWLRDKVSRLYTTDQDFAREAGISASAVSRLLAGKGQPTPSTLEKIAPALRTSTAHLFRLAYPQAGTATEVTRDMADSYADLHPLALELDRMLASDSPVPDDDRRRIGALVDALLAPYRRYMSRRRRATG